jgi:transcriptional regulator with GAF, ATPase, and Fis domain
LVSHETGEDRKPTVVLPLQTAIAQPLAMVISWEPGTRVDAGFLQWLDLLTSQFGKATPVGEFATTGKEEAILVLRRLRDDLATSDRIQDAMHLIDSALRQVVAYDILRIAVYDSRGSNVTQYCLGQGKNLLTERNRSISTQKTNLGALFQSPQVTCSSALAQSDLEDDRWLSSLGAQHALTIPVLSGEKAVAAVTLAAETTGFNKSLGEKIALALSAALLPLVRSDSFSHQLVAYNRQILDLTGTLKKLLSSDDTTAFLSELAETVVKKLPATYCRFWRYNSDQETLEFVADSQSRDVSDHVTDTRILSLSRARWHKLTIQAGRMMLINQREERMQMDDQELVQSLVVGMQSALLAPMMAGNRAIGIMAVAEMRNWDRRSFSLTDSLFARGIANIAAQALLSAASAQRVEQLSRHVDRLEQVKQSEEVFSDLPKRLATPLTSIMARTQQLMDRTEEPDEQTAKNLSIIKMQTEKIMNDVRTLQEVRRERVIQRQP